MSIESQTIKKERGEEFLEKVGTLCLNLREK
jgi:hypothetical protein